MKSSTTTLALAVSGALALSLGAASLQAAENPFAMKTLSNGYQVADHHEKMKDGKCGTGKCGAAKKEGMEKEAEGKCNADMKHGEGSCGADKMKEGSCHGDMKGKEGSCAADKK
ncbi:MAG TPA: hypothetical protein VGD04_07960 [Methylophilus sp.]